MDNKSILLIVLLVFLIFNMFYLCKQTKEKFSDTKYTSQNLIDMFNSLEVAEKRCEELEERRNLKDEKEKIKINHVIGKKNELNKGKSAKFSYQDKMRQIKAKHKNAYKPWTNAEELELLNLFMKKISIF